LDNSDDISGDFRISSALVTPAPDFVDLQFDVRVENAEFEEMLDTGAAAIRARWKCSATFSSGALDLRVAPLDNGSLRCEAQLDQDDVDGRTDISLYIVAGRPLDLDLASQHGDYGGATFAVARGAVLAHAGTFSFDARKSYDPMRPPLESCFRFLKKEGKKPFVDIDSSLDEHIDVYIPEAQYEQFTDQAAMPEVQVATVVLPALVQALVDCAAETDPDVGGWKATLRSLCERHSVTGSDPLVQAQAILGDPIATGFNRLALLIQDEEGE